MRKHLGIVLAMAMALSLTACGGAKESTSSVSDAPFKIDEAPVVVEQDNQATSVEKKDEVIPPNSYRSELTNEWISNDIKTRRPIAVMVDNEQTALPHYGTSDADIVYEMMNSTLNNRITRLMCIFKDWENVDAIGNIRSTRTTNAMLIPEYNAILLHDGGPYFIEEWLAYPNATNHLSGGFARIDRGKQGFYEEYATNVHYKGEGEYAGNSYMSVRERIEDQGWDLDYNKYYLGEHFKFADSEVDLSKEKNAISAKTIKPNFPHNESTLKYDEKKGVYVYSEYNQEYKDAAYSDGRGLEFKNLIIYATTFFDHGDGYLTYAAIGKTDYGYYCTNGQAIPIWWEKTAQDELTKFYRMSDNKEIELNTGKTYIALCPLDTFESDFVIK